MGSFFRSLPKENFGKAAQRGFVYQNRYAVVFCLLILYDRKYQKVDKILSEFHEDIVLNCEEGIRIIQTKTNQNVFGINHKKIIQTFNNFITLESKFGNEIKGYYIIAENGFYGLDNDCILSDYMNLYQLTEKSKSELDEKKLEKISPKIMLRKGIPFDYLYPMTIYEFRKRQIDVSQSVMEKIYKVIVDKILGEKSRMESIYSLELIDFKKIINDKSLTRKELVNIIMEDSDTKQVIKETSPNEIRSHKSFTNIKPKLLEMIKNDLDTGNGNLQKNAVSLFYKISLDDLKFDDKHVWSILKKLIYWGDRYFIIEGLVSFYNVLINGSDLRSIIEKDEIDSLKQRLLELEQTNIQDRISEDCFKILEKILDYKELSDFCLNRLRYTIINLPNDNQYFSYMPRFRNYFEQNKREDLIEELREIIENHQGIAATRASSLYQHFFQKYYP